MKFNLDGGILIALAVLLPEFFSFPEAMFFSCKI